MHLRYRLSKCSWRLIALRLSGVFLILTIALATAQAQVVKGLVSGAIKDAGGKPIAGASVLVVENATDRQRNSHTDNQGEFAVASLPPGDYRVEVESEGFRKQARNFTLPLDQEIRFEIALLPGLRTESIEVVAAPEPLRAHSAALGGLIENRQVTNLPLDGRNFFELGLLLAGVAPPAQGSAGSVRGDFAVNINGAREDSNNFILDGVSNGDPKLNGATVTPPVDAVREFDVASGAYDASLGRNSGGQFNVALKSGTNGIHGTVYEFLRNRVTDARNFFAPSSEKSPQYERNQFGASLGGPVVRNRTFFFADYEGRRLREGITRVTNVPTDLERIGNFSQSGLPVIDPTTGAPIPNKVLPTYFRNPIGLAIAGLYPHANRSTPGRNYVSSPADRDRGDHFDVRVDHRLGAGDDLALRYSCAGRWLYEAFTGLSFAAIPGFGDNVERRAQNGMLSESHVFSPNLLNDFRFGFNRVAAGVFQEDFGKDGNASVGLPTVSTNPRDRGVSLINITGFSPIGDEYNNPQHSASTIFQLTDSIAWAHGRHLVRAGADFRMLRQNAYRDVLAMGYMTFLGMSGNSLEELLLGVPTVTGVALADNAQHLRARSEYAFVQDVWRATPSVTITAGLRYEYNAPPVDAFNRAAIFDAATKSLVRASGSGASRSGYRPDRNNFAPRVGLAWNPGQKGTLLRAGYGVYYDQGSLATGEGLYFNAPYYVSKLYYSFSQYTLSLYDPFPKSYPLTLPSSALAFQPDLRSAYSQQWNLSVQQQFWLGASLEVSYAGSKGTKLLGARDLNQPLPSAQPYNPRPLPQFDDINILESRGNSNFHSLQTRFQQTLHRGFTVLASYTWSKSIDDGSGFFATAGDPNYPQDSNHANLERGRSDFDVRHRLSLSYSYELPFGKSRLLGGWRTLGVWSFQTGRPFTAALLSDLDNSNTGRSTLGFGANDRPNALRSAAISNPGPDGWFDTTAFALPAYGTFGNAGRNILTGPGSQSVNASLLKDAMLADGVTLQFRAEAFNLLNHTNFDLPDGFFGSPTFGKILSAGSPRRIQFGLKLLF